MKKYLLLIVSFSLTISYSQRKIKKLEIEEKGFQVNLKFNPVKITSIYQGLTLKITPISASDLNKKFLNESSFNGKFQYSYYEKSNSSYFLKRPKRKREKSAFEFLLEGADWLYDNDSINKVQYESLIKQIVFNFDEKNAEKIYNEDRIVSSNPYYLGDNYLNTFKLEIENTSSNLKVLDFNPLIESGSLLLNALSDEQLKELLEKTKLSNKNKLLTINRHNLKKSIIVPPNSSIIKYFSTLPIDFNNKKLNITTKNLNEKFEWEIERKLNTINQKNVFYEFKNVWYFNSNDSDNGMNFWYIKKSNLMFFTNEAIFIDEKALNRSFEIVTLSLYADKIYFSKVKIKGEELLELDRNRREKFRIRTKRIEELKKKVKL